MPNYVPPDVNANFFTCPYCETLAEQPSEDLAVVRSGQYAVSGGTRRRCASCGEHTWWVGTHLAWPHTRVSGPVGDDAMPDDVRDRYEEARRVFALSPTSAAALLRGALERLLRQHLHQSGSLDQMIDKLANSGVLSRSLGEAMEAVRLSGNGVLHAADDSEILPGEQAKILFQILNQIVSQTLAVENFVKGVIASATPVQQARIEARHAPAIEAAPTTENHP